MKWILRKKRKRKRNCNHKIGNSKSPFAITTSPNFFTNSYFKLKVLFTIACTNASQLYEAKLPCLQLPCPQEERSVNLNFMLLYVWGIEPPSTSWHSLNRFRFLVIIGNSG